ncbi:DUF4817 domain-containing protein [Trichonephila clavipes]|nr:DUF4817 domain-containing protein [Trichonephila clavipes]
MNAGSQNFSVVTSPTSETGWFHITRHGTGQRRAVRSPSLEAVAHHISLSHQTVCRVLNENHLHRFHLQRVQALNRTDHPLHLNFCQWMVQQGALESDFKAHVLFTAEATFTRDGVFKARNSHM